jgi:hypothetical protein
MAFILRPPVMSGENQIRKNVREKKETREVKKTSVAHPRKQ